MDEDNVVLFDCSQRDYSKYVVGAYSIFDLQDGAGPRLGTDTLMSGLDLLWLSRALYRLTGDLGRLWVFGMFGAEYEAELRGFFDLFDEADVVRVYGIRGRPPSEPPALPEDEDGLLIALADWDPAKVLISDGHGVRYYYRGSSKCLYDVAASGGGGYSGPPLVLFRTRKPEPLTACIQQESPVCEQSILLSLATAVAFTDEHCGLEELIEGFADDEAAVAEFCAAYCAKPWPRTELLEGCFFDVDVEGYHQTDIAISAMRDRLGLDTVVAVLRQEVPSEDIGLFLAPPGEDLYVQWENWGHGGDDFPLDSLERLV